MFLANRHKCSCELQKQDEYVYFSCDTFGGVLKGDENGISSKDLKQVSYAFSSDFSGKFDRFFEDSKVS